MTWCIGRCTRMPRRIWARENYWQRKSGMCAQHKKNIIRYQMSFILRFELSSWTFEQWEFQYRVYAQLCSPLRQHNGPRSMREVSWRRRIFQSSTPSEAECIRSGTVGAEMIEVLRTCAVYTHWITMHEMRTRVCIFNAFSTCQRTASTQRSQPSNRWFESAKSAQIRTNLHCPRFDDLRL